MKTTEEKNRMIAEFMGVLHYRPSGDYIERFGDPYEIEDAQYHTSWDWLMPVVEKCAILNNEEGFDPFKDLCDLSLHENHPAYIEVVRFIEWYNKSQSEDEPQFNHLWYIEDDHLVVAERSNKKIDDSFIELDDSDMPYVSYNYAYVGKMIVSPSRKLVAIPVPGGWAIFLNDEKVETVKFE